MIHSSGESDASSQPLIGNLSFIGAFQNYGSCNTDYSFPKRINNIKGPKF